MRLLLDTELLLWIARDTEKLSSEARSLIGAEENALFFSIASLWEIAIKHTPRRPDFIVDVAVLRRRLLANDYGELAVEASHAIAFADLPAMHKDPFDRMLLTQAMCEKLPLVTTDDVLRRYEGPIIRV
ncbi:MAG: type II toxin-antitoxin system VapC family toxin [Mesorhizobium sp.]|nr:type II toxin-antitoxin system VapC family toxin [Mesorhizobium sp.]